MTTINRSGMKMLMEREVRRYVAERPKSRALFERAKASLLGGVPMNWMKAWPGPFPFFAKEAKGAYVTDVDDHRYVDFQLGDNGALYGHSPIALVDVVRDQVSRGVTLFLPTEDSIWVGEELARRFGLPYWQIYMTATDANRFALKIAREITKREWILVFNGCYYGTVDETLVSLKDGIVGPNPECIGPLPNATLRTRVIEFNDLDALEAALSSQDIACVLCEPAMTNVGIIHPEPGYHVALREMTRRFGTLLILDEAQNIAGGLGGLTRAWNLEPDIFTLGKPIASGFPAAVMGVSQKVAERFLSQTIVADGVSGIGGTLAANALAVAAIRVTLEHVMTESAYERMMAIADRLVGSINRIIESANLQWHVARYGCRVECKYCPTPPRNATESEGAFDSELDSLIHLFFLNRGILTGQWHYVRWLVGAQTTAEDIDCCSRVFGECVKELVG